LEKLLMNESLRLMRPVAAILICASLMLTLSLGLRQSLGLFMQPMTRDIAITVSEFTFAIAIQNLAWGLAQPFTGALVVRAGFRTVMVAGGVLYALGLACLAMAQGVVMVTLGAGVLIGLALACNASSIANSVASRAVPAAVRSTVLGLVSAAGSLGAMLAAPIGQWLQTDFGWRAGVLGFVAFALILIPAGWIAGRVDKVKLPPPAAGDIPEESDARRMALAALRHPPFVVMTLAFFVCGMQLVFLTTHLPSYLDLCGMDPMLSAQALGMIGGFNILGSLFFGWAGGRWSKTALLGTLYISRSLVLAWFFSAPPTPGNTLLFAGLMGFLWMGVSPLFAGAVAEMFGLRWQAMIQGIAFFSHQIGSFLGAFGGGMVFDAFGSYDLAWRFGVGLGLTAGVVQVVFALMRPPAALAR
jgi:predicted MFS family arabinose efflux permease